MRLPDSWTNGTRLALAVRVLVVLLALVGAIILSVWGVDLARRIGKLGGPGGPSAEQQVLALQTDLGRLRTENAKLTATMEANAAATKAALATADKLKAATALQEQQASQIKALELENSKLKEDAVATTSKLPASKKAAAAKAASKAAKVAAVPAGKDGATAKVVAVPAGKDGAPAKVTEELVKMDPPKTKAAAAASKLVNHGLALRRFEADQPAPKQLHYRLLLSQPATAPKLAGRLQLVVTGSKGGKAVVLKYPSASTASAAQYVVKLGTLQRCEGLLALPEGVIVKSIQARVLEKGQVRIARSVTLKDAAHVRS